MIQIVAAGLAAITFLVVLRAVRVVPIARDATALLGQALTTMRDRTLSDAHKERVVREGGIRLLGTVFSLALRSAAALLASLAVIMTIALLGDYPPGLTFDFLARGDVLIGSFVLALAWVSISRWTRGQRDAKDSPTPYSPMERALHRIAFSSRLLPMTASDLEDLIDAGAIARVDMQPPIFITALPRAGTTVLLNALHELPGIATHRYRDMPFVTAPLLWSRLSRRFQESEQLRERAHGDGLMIGYDSPESFEEILWRLFWPNKYQTDRILLWHGDDLNSDADVFFQRHFRKLVLLRCNGRGRYLSKNNGNIARLDLLPRMFPDAKIIVPLRDPLEHAASLLRQHRNFLEQHHRDPFVQRYMRDVGHYEFGALHRPLHFDGFNAITDGLTPDDPDYWLSYWLAAYRTVEMHLNGVCLAPLPNTDENSEAVFSRVVEYLGLTANPKDLARHWRAIPSHANAADYDARLLQTSRSLYERLVATSAG